LDDVQIAYFERIAFSLRNFDLVFIFNDWNEKPVQINSIPIESLETIREWLDSCNIKYYSGKINLNWRKLLDQISLEPKKFWDDGGWAIFDDKGGDDDEDEMGASSHGDGSEGAQEAGGSKRRGSKRSTRSRGKRAEGADDEEVFRGEEDYRPSGSDESDDYDADYGVEAEDEGDPDPDPEPQLEEDDGQDWEDMEKVLENEDKRAALKRKQGGSGYDSDEERRSLLGRSASGAPPRKTPKL